MTKGYISTDREGGSSKGLYTYRQGGGKWQRVIHLQTGMGEVAKGFTPTDRDGGSSKGFYTYRQGWGK